MEESMPLLWHQRCQFVSLYFVHAMLLSLSTSNSLTKIVWTNVFHPQILFGRSTPSNLSVERSPSSSPRRVSARTYFVHPLHALLQIDPDKLLIHTNPHNLNMESIFFSLQSSLLYFLWWWIVSWIKKYVTLFGFLNFWREREREREKRERESFDRQ